MRIRDKFIVAAPLFPDTFIADHSTVCKGLKGKMSELNVFRGNVIDSSDGLNLNVQQCLLGVQGSKIIFREPAHKMDDVCSEYDFDKEAIHSLSKGQFLMPGLVDIHLHAPQYHFAGSKMDYTLLPWLELCTLPAEAKFKDLDFANNVFNNVLQDTINNGTTTAVYFSTIHLDASLLLTEIAEKKGQRVYVGKVNMDTNSPDYYKETTEESMKSTEEFIIQVQNKKNPLINPIVTPRFAVNCTAQLLQFLGETARKYNTAVQSHLAENKDECNYVKELFPDCNSYTDIYDKFKLLTAKTVMAHGIHLSQGEMDLLIQRGTGIAHCPNSNISLRSGLCDVRKLLDNGVKVGLGTDIGGGYSPSVLDSIRQALISSKVLSLENSSYKFLNYQEVFRMATLGGCEVLGIDKTLGTLEVGKQFDALLVDVNETNISLKFFPEDTLQDTVEKFFHHGDDRNIKSVYVDGKQIK